MSEKSNSAIILDSPGRRGFLRKIGIAGAVLGAAGVRPAAAQTATAGPTDVDILNFALNLEYLEAEFYSFATTGQGIEQAGLGINGAGASGPTTGGAQVAFTDTTVKAVAQELAKDEQQHVVLIRSALSAMGAQPVAKPAINLGALGVGFASQTEFLTLARIFEDVGVTAYGGAAPLIQDKTILGVAARILATEAVHSGNIRLQAARAGIAQMPVDGVDHPAPPSGSQYFPTNEQGLTEIRTPGQVLALVYAAANAKSGGFFPQGVNGTLNTSTAAAAGGATTGASGATLSASPNPIVVTGNAGGVTTIAWNAPAAQTIEVHVDRPTGGLLTRWGGSGSMQTGAWVRDGMTFFLQDVSNGKLLTAENTLATVVVRVQRM